MKLPRELVVDEYDLPSGGSAEHAVEVLEDTIVDTSRWSTEHLLTVRIKDRFYQTRYRVGATECQEEYPWDDQESVEFKEVVRREKMVQVWVPVEAV